MSTNETFTGLIRLLATPAVFYLPPSHVDNQFRGLFEQPLDPYMNTLLYVTPKLKTKPIAMPLHLHKIIAKRHKLEENIFELADLKEVYGKRKFKYLVDRYVLFLNAICFYSEILHIELMEHFPAVSNTIYLAFKLQYYNFIEHRKSVMEVCNIKELKPFSLEDFTLLGAMNSPLFSTQNLQQSLNLNPTQSQPENYTGSKNKEEFINEVEIESFLLESVFNIKVD